jgi:hypothetical protein
VRGREWKDRKNIERTYKEKERSKKKGENVKET